MVLMRTSCTVATRLIDFKYPQVLVAIPVIYLRFFLKLRCLAGVEIQAGYIDD